MAIFAEVTENECISEMQGYNLIATENGASDSSATCLRPAQNMSET